MKTATTILEQLGGNQFVAMTGARNLIGDDRALNMRIGKNAERVTHVRVFLNDADTYDVTYMRVRGCDVRTVAKSEGVYADGLRADFERRTGLRTSL